MIFEKFEGVESQLRLWNLERLLEDVGGFVLHEKQIAVCFILTDLLHDAKEVDAGEEVTPRELCYRFRWLLGGWIAQLVHSRDRPSACMLAFLESEGWKLVFDFGDRQREFATRLDRGWRSFIFALFFGLNWFRWCMFTVRIAESEKTIAVSNENSKSENYLPHIIAVCLIVDDLVYLLVSE